MAIKLPKHYKTLCRIEVSTLKVSKNGRQLVKAGKPMCASGGRGREATYLLRTSWEIS